MFDHRSLQLLNVMVHYPKLSIPELRLQMNLTPRQFAYSLDKLNDGLTSQSLPKIQLFQTGFKIDERIKAYWNQEELSLNRKQLIFQENERLYLIYLYTYIRREQIAIIHYQSLLQVSRNTALADVKKLRALCQGTGVKLSYNRTNGFYLEGEERYKRRFASVCIGSLLQLPMGRSGIQQVLDSWKYEDKSKAIRLHLSEMAREYAVDFVGNRLDQLIYELLFLQFCYGRHHLTLPKKQIQLIKTQPLFQMGKALSAYLFDEVTETEIIYLTIQLLSATQGISHIHPNEELINISDAIIHEVERLTFVPFKEKHILQSILYKHLVPAYFRIMCEVPLSNPLIDTIQTEHGVLFRLVKQALKPFSDYTGQLISDEEIGYFTILFGGHVRKLETKAKVYRATIVCPNGVSSSMMLQTQLRQLFPYLHFTESHSVAEMEKISPDSYDMIFSTIYLESPKPVYLTRPLLTALEEEYLQQAVAADFNLPDQSNVPIDEFMATIRRHATIKNERALYEELTKHLRKSYSTERSYTPMLFELLTADKIHFTKASLDWREAITLAAKPLEEQHYITSDYTQAMIDRVLEIGPFIHVGKGIAIPHARPEQGVEKLGMSLLRLEEPVLLLDQKEHAIDMFICLAAIDNKLHLKALTELTSFLVNEESLQRLKNATTADEIIAMMQKKGEDKK
ncbi:BglG family transcription antiterminator [Paenibacillus albidus]|uniref:BglG family transcription antiterminator n=1 Tax=Paenibacillus albidus TaxID=2041023 RepID=UPI001BE9AE3D|nr:BglG family transcription antiterminator [Paenibacillus albidus]MBT2292852.1 BglG family transcription antiterminator [Paenibacillus albidus]